MLIANFGKLPNQCCKNMGVFGPPFYTMEDKYFLKEKDFLDVIKNREQKLYGVLKVNTHLSLTPDLLIKKDFDIEYLNCDEFNGEITYNEGIFKHRSGFFIYLSKSTISEITFKVRVYYDVVQLEEVKFFIKNLIKSK